MCETIDLPYYSTILELNKLRKLNKNDHISWW